MPYSVGKNPDNQHHRTRPRNEVPRLRSFSPQDKKPLSFQDNKSRKKDTPKKG